MLLKKITTDNLMNLKWCDTVHLLNEPVFNPLGQIKNIKIYAYYQLEKTLLLNGNYYLKDGIQMTY
jgi:hypothetical protein